MVNINYITGYAGTGKSHSLIKQVNNLPIDGTIVIAPTHKALSRLRDFISDTIEIKTIHSLLGWIPSINERATKVQHIDSTHKLDKDLKTYSHIIIDEAGMMSEDMLMDIIAKIEAALDYNDEATSKINIYCYLDPYQLLPVKGTQIQIDPEHTTNLTKQYRSESLDVVNLYTKFVYYINPEHSNTDDLTTPYSDNVRKLDIKAFKRGDRLLAYTNKAVGVWNIKIAKSLGINNYIGQEVQLGNMIDTQIVVKLLDKKDIDILSLFDSGKLILQNSNIKKAFLEQSLKALVTHKDIEFIEAMNGKVYPVIIGVGKGNKLLKAAKAKAIADSRAFKHIYTLGRAFIMDYTFATTVHKSQGSEFSNVFIDKIDIQKSIMNGYYINYARLMYVSISRAKTTIYI